MNYYTIKNYSKVGKIAISNAVFRSLTINFLEEEGYQVHSVNRLIYVLQPVIVDIKSSSISIHVKIDVKQLLNKAELDALAKKLREYIFSYTECIVEKIVIKMHK